MIFFRRSIDIALYACIINKSKKKDGLYKMTRIFIDGKAGTTGLKIFSRFQNRSELELIQIDEDKRKDPAERAKCINDSDITFLCLPDPAAIEAVALVTNLR